MLPINDPTLPADQAVRRAARDFVRALARQDLLRQAARLEATLYSTGEGCLFGLDRTLSAAWPADAGPPPAQELILVRSGGQLTGLKLTVFDALGRALLRHRYKADATGGVRRLNEDRKADDHV